MNRFQDKIEKAHSTARKPRQVMKFGGTSVGDASCIARVVEITRVASRDYSIAVVVSAMGGVTNRLIEAANQSKAGNESAVADIFSELTKRHDEAVKALIHSAAERHCLQAKLHDIFAEGQRLCQGSIVSRELTLRTLDAIAGLGERLCARIVTAALVETGVASEAIDATELVVTDSCHGAAEPAMDLTRARCQSRVLPLLREGILPVVTGFIGATEEGVITTLGRGGSDYSATILGAALDADGVVIWSDVTGLLTADPRLVPEARTIPEISYREAAELAYFGAKVLHPKTLRPVMRRGIPVWIRNTFEPEEEGTKITPGGPPNANADGARALAAIGEASLITVVVPTVNGVSGTSGLSEILARTVATADAVQADVLAIWQSSLRPSSPVNICLVTPSAMATRTVVALRREFFPGQITKKADAAVFDAAVSVITLVGHNLRGVSNIAMRAGAALGQNDVNVIATVHGSSECSLSLVLPQEGMNRALVGIHRELGLGALPTEGPPAHGDENPSACGRASRRRQTEASATVFHTSDLISNPTMQLVGKSADVRGTTSGVPRMKGKLMMSRQARNRGIAEMAADSTAAAAEREILDEATFQRMITRERKRTERSENPFLLMLLDLGHGLPSERQGQVLRKLLTALSSATRETDVTGWYWQNSVVGLMFTEITAEERSSIVTTMMSRVSEVLQSNLSLRQFSKIGMSFHLYPEDWDQETAERPGNPTLYPDLIDREHQQKHLRITKRVMDVIGSGAALLLLSPVFAVIALLTKLTSKGPVIYRQQRLGQFGETFELLKFRSMCCDSDPKIHQEFMKNVIAGTHDGKTPDCDKPVYKMTNDPRITVIGAFLRRSSLDELPQFFNVLKGDMSLVGPRPPLAYEWEEYEIWHRRRVLEAKPGITGLWQTQGRSHVCFDDMVRLDLQYVKTWSLWLDLRILMKTPRAVLMGDDAF